MVALTYYAHRDKLRDVGRAGDLEAMNRQAVRIANEIAAEGGALVAGNICNTWSYDPRGPRGLRRRRARPVRGAARLGGRGGRSTSSIAETHDYVGEARIALDGVPGARPPGHGHVRQRPGRDHLRRLRLRRRLPHPRGRGRDDRRPELLARARRRCCRCSSGSGRRSTSPWPPCPCPTARRRPRRPSSRSPPTTAGGSSRSSSSRSSARASRWPTSRAGPRDLGVDYLGICCGGGPHHVRAMAEALGRDTRASRYSPAIELHPVLGAARGEHERMGGWAAEAGDGEG